MVFTFFLEVTNDVRERRRRFSGSKGGLGGQNRPTQTLILTTKDVDDDVSVILLFLRNSITSKINK